MQGSSENIYRAQINSPVREAEATLVVIGGGAAGFFCAVNAARINRKLKVIILEKSTKLLSKVKISGGGRCNVTHALFDISEMSTRYPRGQNFTKKIFHQFFTTDTIKWFNERGVELKTEMDGRMFPVTDSSQTIVECLMHEANKYNVEIRMNSEVKNIAHENGKFHLQLSDLRTLNADFICVASGGYPKASQFNWLLNLGHSIAEPVPSLFTFNLPTVEAGLSKHPITELMGLSVEKVRVKVEGIKLLEEGSILITHWGFSGPVILRLSAWGAIELAEKKYNFKIHINWVPEINERMIKQRFHQLRKLDGGKKILNLNFTQLPNRLWQFLVFYSGITENTRIADLPVKSENALIKSLVDFVEEIKGKTTFKEEFVTAGGILTSEVDVNTIMSKKIQNLYFAGEVLNVDGITGGFNFQHAWSTGWIAANSIARAKNLH